MKRLLAEFIGTFALVFAGTGAIIVNDLSHGAITHAGVAAAFGLVVAVMIYAVGDISGAHFNPAVTVAFAASKRFPFRDVPGYIAVQCAGAFLASILLKMVLPAHDTLGSTLPGGSETQSFVFETVLTFFLVLVILCATTGTKEKTAFAGIAIGGTVALGALFGGPISGASMNPARSLAPALVSHHLEHLWLYIAAPIFGGIIATAASVALKRSEA